MMTPAEFYLGSMLSAADRCDRCSARATALLVLDSGGQLLFCGHHARRYRTALEQVGELVADEPHDEVCASAAA